MTALSITQTVSIPWDVPFKFTMPQEMQPSNWGLVRKDDENSRFPCNKNQPQPLAVGRASSELRG